MINQSGSLFGIVLMAGILASCGSPPSLASDLPENGSISQSAQLPYHHIDGGFQNPPGSPARTKSVFKTLRFFAQAVSRNIAGPDDSLPADHVLPTSEVQEQLDQSGPNSVTWIGHATFLVKLGDYRILTDPMFSKRASPFSFAGPERLSAPALDLSELTDVDAVVISHSHYDHLDLESLQDLPNKENVTAIVPLGLGKYVQGFGAIHEVDWYDRVKIGDLEVSAYPAIHWSSRTPFDQDETLWMSYAIHANGATVYHTGDTETHPTVFKDIGKDMQTRYGGCSLGLMSIGAYAPREFMYGAHMDPEGGVAIGRDLGCQEMVPMHWGTFILSFEPLVEPAERFEKAAGDMSRRLRIGETLSLKAF